MNTRTYIFLLSIGLILLGPLAVALLAQDPVVAPDPAATVADPPAAAAGTSPVDLGDPAIYSKSLRALTMFFVLAVLLENAFAVLFNWRVFLVYFSRRGIRTLVMIIASWITVNAFDLDILVSIVQAYSSSPLENPSGLASTFVSALILAGGSGGVNRIMKALGYRSPATEEVVDPTPPKKEAWIAIRVVGQRPEVRNVRVMINELGNADDKSPDPIAGCISFRLPSLRSILLRNSDRFPQNGGYKVTPNKVYKISVEGTGLDGKKYVGEGLQDSYVFADRTIADFEVKLKESEE